MERDHDSAMHLLGRDEDMLNSGALGGISDRFPDLIHIADNRDVLTDELDMQALVQDTKTSRHPGRLPERAWWIFSTCDLRQTMCTNTSSSHLLGAAFEQIHPQLHASSTRVEESFMHERLPVASPMCTQKGILKKNGQKDIKA